MTSFTKMPYLTQNGVIFTVDINSMPRQCLVSREALMKLSELKNIDSIDADMMEIFHAFGVTIDGVARRLLAENFSDTPLELPPNAFH